ncbi:MAG: hypothetical protein GX446_12475, partial [Chthonomonadales bacterium]|nr:hypothetical protein [Chthonomonadales bacterium]
AGDKGRIGLDVYRRDPRIVYAVVEAQGGGVFRSEDSGDNWTRQSATNPRPMYFSKIRVDPNDDQFIWLAGVSFMRSKDGGKTFGTESGARLHADIHAIWINPANSKHMLVGCDGGIQWSHDRGQTWDHINTIPLAQFYHVAFDMQRPYNVAGGLQDNGSWLGPSSRPGSGGPRHSDWQNIGGGDGFYCAIDPSDPNTVYSESQNGAVRRVHLATGASKAITPRPNAGEPRYRWDWCTPFMLSPHNPRKVLLGGNRLFISTDRGDTWRRTEDLSTNPDTSTFVLMGVKRGRSYPFPDLGSDYGQIVTLTESPVREGVLYVGTDDGNLQVSQDDGKTWVNVATNVPGVPKGTYVSRVHASPHSVGRIYAAFDGHRGDDYTPYAFVSEDFGATWRPIAKGIPPGSTINVVRDHPYCENLLFAGTDRGLYVSTDRGATWTRFGKPLPPLRVDDVVVHPRENDLIVATHARGIYILDDISHFVAVASGKLTGKIALLQPRKAVMYRASGGMSSLQGNRVYVTPGAPTGATIRYWLASEPSADQALTLTIEDQKGRVLRSRRLLLASAGLNSTTWDFRRDPPGASGTAQTGAAPSRASTGPQSSGRAATAGRQAQAGQSASRGRVTAMGPRVLPGRYIVRLRMGDETQTRYIDVEQDPRVTLSLRQQRELSVLTEGLMARAMELQRHERWLEGLETAVTKAIQDEAMKAAPKPIAERLAALQGRTRQARAQLRGGEPAPTGPATETLGPSGEVIQLQGRATASVAARLSQYYMTLETMPEAPSKQLRAEMTELMRTADTIAREARNLRERELPGINKLLTGAKLPTITVADQAAVSTEAGVGGTVEADAEDEPDQ